MMTEKKLERMTRQLLGEEPIEKIPDEQEECDNSDDFYDSEDDDIDDYYEDDNLDDDENECHFLPKATTREENEEDDFELSRGIKPAIIIILVLLLVFFGFGIWFYFIRPSEPNVVTLETEITEEQPTVSGNSVSENSISDNSVSENSVSENSISGNSVSGNSVSENDTSEKQTSSSTRKPIDVTVKINSIKIVYGAKEIDPSYDVEGTKKENLSKYITVTRTPGNDVGQYPINATCSAPKNLYNVTIIPGTYTITPREVTIQADNKESFVGEALKTLTYTIVSGSIVKGDEVVKLYTGADPAKAGTYDIVDKWKNSNYALTVKVGKYTVKARQQSSSQEQEVKKQKLSVIADNKESYVGETLKTLTCRIQSGTLKAGDSIDSVIDLTTNATPNKAGRYKIEVTCKNSNYDVETIDGTYTVKEKEVPREKSTVQLVNASSVYGERIIDKFDFEVVSGELTKSELIPYISAAKDGEETTVGDYPITGSCSNPEWDVTVLEATYTITPRPLSVKADDKLTYEGDPLEDLTYTVTEGSIVNGDDVISLSSDATPSTIKEYMIIVTCINPNYTVHGENGTYRVKAKSRPPKDDDEEVEKPSDGPEDDEEDVKPNQPTLSDKKTSNGPSDEGEEVQPSTSTP